MDDNNIPGFELPAALLLSPAEAIQAAGSFENFAKKVVSAIDPASVQKIARNLGLSFIPDKENPGEVCFINSEEVRPEFKLSFASVDLLDYILAVLGHFKDNRQSLVNTSGLVNIPYPKDTVSFWEFVKQGEQLRLMY